VLFSPALVIKPVPHTITGAFLRYPEIFLESFAEIKKDSNKEPIAIISAFCGGAGIIFIPASLLNISIFSKSPKFNSD